MINFNHFLTTSPTSSRQTLLYLLTHTTSRSFSFTKEKKNHGVPFVLANYTQVLGSAWSIVSIPSVTPLGEKKPDCPSSGCYQLQIASWQECPLPLLCTALQLFRTDNWKCPSHWDFTHPSDWVSPNLMSRAHSILSAVAWPSKAEKPWPELRLLLISKSEWLVCSCHLWVVNGCSPCKVCSNI